MWEQVVFDMVVGLFFRSIVSDYRAFQTSFGRGLDWKVRRLVDVSEEFRELLGEDVLALVGGRVRKKGEEKPCTADNPDDAVKKYILECLPVRDGVVYLDVEVEVVELDAIALAEFEVLFPNGSHKGYYQASIVIRGGA